MSGLLVLNSPGDFGSRLMSYWSCRCSVCMGCAVPIRRAESVIRMQQCIIHYLMAAEHVFTMTRAPQADWRDWGK